jgi:hypothetical protein
MQTPYFTSIQGILYDIPSLTVELQSEFLKSILNVGSVPKRLEDLTEGKDFQLKFNGTSVTIRRIQQGIQIYTKNQEDYPKEELSMLLDFNSNAQIFLKTNKIKYRVLYDPSIDKIFRNQRIPAEF